MTYPAPDSYQIAIPTFRRAETVVAKTLATLARGNVDPARITLWVATRDEADAYAAVVPRATYGQLRISVPGIGPSRNFINRAYPEGSFLLSCDDDLSAIYHKDGDGRRDADDLHAVFTQMFAELTRTRLTLVGVYPVDNPWFMSPGYTTNLRYIIAACYGQHLRREPWYDVTLEDKEDYERSILHFVHTGGVLRRNDIGMVTRYYKEPGGMQVTRTEARIHDSAVTLARRYPDLVRLRTSKAGHTEIAFRRIGSQRASHGDNRANATRASEKSGRSRARRTNAKRATGDVQFLPRRHARGEAFVDPKSGLR